MAKYLTNHEQNMRIIDQVGITSAGLGIILLSTEDEKLDGRRITVFGKQLINFSSCSYLGLEHHPRVKEKAIEAIQNYGTQFSSSRAYISIGLYRELENQLSMMFEAPVVVSASTTLGHISNMPVLIGSKDVVILDAQVHASVQTAVQFLKSRNVPIELIRHNRMDILEDRILELKDKYEKIWYMADGVYSMYGDYAPLEELMKMLNQYEQLHLYIDDAHGMSWIGKHGTGYAKTGLPRHQRIFLVTSLNKAFAAGGGALIYPNEEWKRKVRNCGSTMVFSGPVQPPSLGAAIASAEIHLSDEIYKLQNQLKDKIKFFVETAKKLELPLISKTLSPIKFIGVGKPGVGYSMVRRLMDAGYYINLSVFPSVSYNNTGLRLPLTNHLTYEDIEGVLTAIARELPIALQEEDSSMKSIYQAFKMVG